MITDISGSPIDHYARKLSQARETRAVLKTEFATRTAAISSDKLIFAFEGRDDKIVYFHWVRKIRDELEYEPYLCQTKDNVLKLFDSLRSDKTGMGDRVYFFVDKDFGGSEGRETGEKLFVTHRYSIENYLVCERVLDDLLNLNLHCEGELKVREEIKALFRAMYEAFLKVTKEINLRLFAAKRLSIVRKEKLADRINQIVEMDLGSVGAESRPAKEIVILANDPSTEELAMLEGEFSRLEPGNDYRGKFALSFFIRWLELLRRDRLSERPIVFREIVAPKLAVSGDYTLDLLAALARPPKELSQFINAIAA